MKKFTFFENEHPLICSLIFKIYLKIVWKKWNRVECYIDNVYDDYDIIDTLGFTDEEGRFTHNYHDELVSIFSVKFLGLEFESISH